MIIGVKSGCYTLFHAGHFWMLEQCAQKCDYLIALANDDEYIRKKKGYVLIPAKERQFILEQNVHVQEAHIFNGNTEDEWIANFRANRMYGCTVFLRVFHSEELQGNDWVPGQAYADDIVFVPKQSSPYDTSVTQIVEKIKGVDCG